jgi:hypothetical protein
MRNTADVTDGKSIAVSSQYILRVSAINTLVAFYDIRGRKGLNLFLHLFCVMHAQCLTHYPCFHRYHFLFVHSLPYHSNINPHIHTYY